MGLDMYLYQVTYEDGKTILSEAAYFRKMNAIHGWFVDNIQDEIDNCAFYMLDGADLEKLCSLIKKALETRDVTILPPRPGFFFGSYEIDDYYWSDLQECLAKLEPLDKDKTYMYSSSW